MKEIKLKYLHDKDPWMLAEDIPDIDVFFCQIWQSCFVNEFIWPSGIRYKKLLSVHRGYHLWFYYGQEDSKKVGDYIAGKFIKNPQFAIKVNKKIVNWSDKLRKFAGKIPEEYLSRLSDRDLWHWYERHDKIHTAYYQWGWIPVAADMFHDNLTNRLKLYLQTIVGENKVNEYLVILTQPRSKSLIQIEQEEFLKIAHLICRDTRQRRIFYELHRSFNEQEATPYGLKTHTPEYERLLEERVEKIKDQIKPAILKKIQDHYRKYFYIKFMWIGKESVYSFDYYLKELVKLIGRGVNPAQELKRVNQEFTSQNIKRKRLLKKLNIRNPWQTIFEAWGDFMVTKIYRRFAQIYAVYRMQSILKEIASRLNLSLKEVRLLLKNEVYRALLKGKLGRQQLKARTKLAVYYYEKDKEVVLTGKKALQLVRQAEKVVSRNITEIKGQVGCVGKTQGTVKIIIRPKDMVKMKKGDVLVSIATDPDIVPAMKKAAAVVTEQGGVTSHAAIVSRELGIPCVIGTKIATKVLKDGDRVEVDAYKGVVKKL